MPPPTSLNVELYLVNLSDIDGDGFIQCQPDAYGGQGGDPIEVLLPQGIWSRPLDPDTDQDGNISAACPMLVFSEGGKRFAIPLTDARSVKKLPSLRKGESMQHGPAANAVRCHEDGTVSISTTADGTPSGQTIYGRIGPKGHHFVGPWGTLKFDANGFHIFTASGARIDMGGIAGVPAPLNSLGAYLRVMAPMVQVIGSAIALGPTAGVADAAAKTGPIVAVLNALSAVLVALATPGAFAVSPGNPLTQAPGPAVAAAIATAISAIATASAPGPTGIGSSSTTVV